MDVTMNPFVDLDDLYVPDEDSTRDRTRQCLHAFGVEPGSPLGDLVHENPQLFGELVDSGECDSDEIAAAFRARLRPLDVSLWRRAGVDRIAAMEPRVARGETAEMAMVLRDAGFGLDASQTLAEAGIGERTVKAAFAHGIFDIDKIQRLYEVGADGRYLEIVRGLGVTDPEAVYRLAAAGVTSMQLADAVSHTGWSWTPDGRPDRDAIVAQVPAVRFEHEEVTMCLVDGWRLASIPDHVLCDEQVFDVLAGSPGPLGRLVAKWHQLLGGRFWQHDDFPPVLLTVAGAAKRALIANIWVGNASWVSPHGPLQPSVDFEPF